MTEPVTAIDFRFGACLCAERRMARLLIYASVACALAGIVHIPFNTWLEKVTIIIGICGIVKKRCRYVHHLKYCISIGGIFGKRFSVLAYMVEVLALENSIPVLLVGKVIYDDNVKAILPFGM